MQANTKNKIAIEKKTLSGKTHNEDYFKIVEYSQPNFYSLMDVLCKKKVGGIFKQALNKKDCHTISDNFWKNPSLRQRGDGVPAYYVGTYHYEKAMNTYLNEAEETRQDVKNLFSNTDLFLEKFINGFEKYLEELGITLRPARHDGRNSGECLMRSWTDSGEFALEPHEDAAQMRTQKQFDFEIKNIPNFTPVAINLCVENGKGGNLILWNFEPDNITRQNLDLLETGYPYPTDVLEPYQKTTIPIKQGDFYFFNGANIHAVSRQATDKEQRSTISFLMGFIDSKTVIYWT